jgi:hypothetical protein
MTHEQRIQELERLLRMYRRAIPHEHFMGHLCSICEETDKAIGPTVGVWKEK